MSVNRAGALILTLWIAGCGSSDEGPETPGSQSGGGSGGGGGGGGSTAADTFGEVHEGEYHLGPVDFAETEWHNACAPAGGYRSALREATGLGNEYLAGVSGAYADGGAVCDACIQVTTETGRSLVLRVVTYGATNNPGDIDVSPAAYAVLNSDEFPRAMRWQFATCPDTGPLRYEFQTEANVYWTSLWVRNPRVPIGMVEVQSANHAEFFELRREGDGTLNDDGGFGEGEFTLRITGMNGERVTETLPGFEPGQLITGSAQL